MASKGNVFTALGASNHTDKERQKEDYYATDPRAAEMLLQVETFPGKVWECACGEKHLAKVFEQHGYTVRSSDIVNRCGNEVFDFLSMNNTEWGGCIVTNPPYRLAFDFVCRSLQIVPDGQKVAMFLRLQFLEGKERREFYRNFPPKTVYVFSQRMTCAANGDFENAKNNTAVAYAWFVWEKGYKGDTVVKWL